MGTYRLSDDAKAELDGIWLYVARESGSIDVAVRLLDSITDRFWLLAEYPLIGRSRDHDLRPGLRSMAVEEYLIVYRVNADADEAFILHVFDGRRDIPAALEEDNA